MTTFGVVSFRASATPAGPGANATASVAVAFSPSGSPGVASAPTFVVRLKSAIPGVGAVRLVASSVAVTGQATLLGVDAAALTATVQLTPSGRGARGAGRSAAPGEVTFQVTGDLVPQAA